MRTPEKKYTTIIFDFGGVLCTGENMRAMARHLARKHHVDFDLLRETILLSNQIVGWLGVYIKRYNLRRVFDVIVPSYDAKFAKPHINIYKITLEKLGEPASACIFIDDIERNLAPARDLGITTIHFRPQHR